MAKAKLNPILVQLSGKMGDFVFKKSKKGEAIVAQRPRRLNTEPSEAQKAQRERFALASEYARAAMADPGIRVHYEKIAGKNGKGAFAAARSDYLRGKDLLAQSPSLKDTART